MNLIGYDMTTNYFSDFLSQSAIDELSTADEFEFGFQHSARVLTITGSNGADHITAWPSDDKILGKKGADTIFAGDGDDTINGGRGADDIYGEDGNDKINGGRGHDFIDGGAGNDVIRGGRGNDFMVGEDGDDRLFGGQDADAMSGGEGNDVLKGGNGFDAMNGDQGNDLLFGGSGDDILGTYAGEDTLVGGQGADVFLFDNIEGAYEDNTVVIEDFQDDIETFVLLDIFIDVTPEQAFELFGDVVDGNTVIVGGSPEDEVNTVVSKGITVPSVLYDDIIFGKSFDDVPRIYDHPLFDPLWLQNNVDVA